MIDLSVLVALLKVEATTLMTSVKTQSHLTSTVMTNAFVELDNNFAILPISCSITPPLWRVDGSCGRHHQHRERHSIQDAGRPDLFDLAHGAGVGADLRPGTWRSRAWSWYSAADRLLLMLAWDRPSWARILAMSSCCAVVGCGGGGGVIIAVAIADRGRSGFQKCGKFLIVVLTYWIQKSGGTPCGATSTEGLTSV